MIVYLPPPAPVSIVFMFRLNKFFLLYFNHYFAVSRFYWPRIVHFKPLVKVLFVHPSPNSSPGKLKFLSKSRR